MKASKLKASITVESPANWKGTYTSNNAYNNASWTWYKDGKASTENAPHITIAFGSSWEVDGTGEWVGFHVSYPMSSMGRNARFNYTIKGGVVSYSNMSKTGLTENALEESNEIARTMATELDEFGQAFFKAATA